MRTDKKSSQRSDKKAAPRGHKQGVVGYSKKSALLEDAITQMNAGKYGRSSAALKELLALDPLNMEARRLFATLHLRLGNLIPARQAFESLVNEAFERQDYWLAESLLREYLAAGPRCVPFIEKLGTIYQDKGDTLAAVTEYGKAIDILVEDPDPDHPQLATQLYAKVRTLAPASPVAFRLASFFDAQSGEMIVRAKPSAPPQPAPVVSPDAVPMETMVAHGAPEPNGEAADTIDAPFSAGAATPSESGSGPSTPVTSSEAALSAGETVSEAASVAVELETNPAESPNVSFTVSDVSTDMPAQPAQDSHADFTFIESVNGEATAGSPSAGSTGSGEAKVDSVNASAVEFKLQSSESAKLPPADHVPSPMPWERVEHAALTIPDREATEPSFAMELQHSTDSTPAPVAGPNGLVERPDGQTASFGEPISSSVAELPSSTVAAEEQKKEGFSWESVFGRAWNFGGAPSGLDQKEDTPNVEIAPAEKSIPDVMPATVQEPTAIQSDVARHAGTEPELPAPAESVPAPMPWDQVQDATISIVPPKDEEQPVIALAGEGAGSPTDMSIADPPQATETRDPAGVESGTLSVSEAVGAEAFGDASSQLTAAVPVSPPDELVPLPAASTMVTDSTVFAAVEPSAPVQSFADAATEASPPDSDLSAEASTQPVAQPAESNPPPTDHLSAPPFYNEEAAMAVGEPAVPAGEPPLALEQPVHWKTGEVAVQTHRPAPKKRKRSPTPEPESVSDVPSVEEPAHLQPPPVLQQEPAAVEPAPPPPAPEPEAWIAASDSIRFVEPSVSSAESAPVPASTWTESSPVQPVSAAVSAVDVLFDSTQRTARVRVQERAASKPGFRLGAALNRIRIGVFVFIRSCFSTTHAVVTTVATLAVLSTIMLVVAIGTVGMVWLTMEEKPAPSYQNLTTVPQRLLTDSKANGYLMLLGFEAAPSVDPVQAGYERGPDGKSAILAAGCLSEQGTRDAKASTDGVGRWFGSSDPAAQFRLNQDLIKGSVGRNEVTLGRYKQWLKMRFEDWGYGQSVSPPCAALLSAHRLFVADGFVQTQGESGIDRLEADMEAWRTTLSQAKTLPVKTLALQAINDDLAVASGLLVRPDGDGVAPDRLTKMLRPLDQMELSLRWPMQSQFVVATKTLEPRLKTMRMEAMPWHVRIASMLPLPTQRYFNDYAKYYEASYKAAGEGRFAALPKRTQYVQFPADDAMDFVRNPIENLIGLEPLAEWEYYSGLVVDTDARLRLASLQAWLRRGPPGANLMAQIARAGQGFYDPYTGFPMLVNLSKGVMYSVGHDGKDQDGHPQADVIAVIPPNIAPTTRVAANASGSK